jgi:NAD(P)-dependent dehydrogenase (short-subunit alcohol dehydrogenase family)
LNAAATRAAATARAAPAGMRRQIQLDFNKLDAVSEPFRFDSSASPSGSLSGRTAVVTGGGRGAGAAIAGQLAAAGASVVVAARTACDVEAVAADIRAAGGRAVAVPCDVADPDAVAELARAASRTFRHVDILVNNAGIAFAAPIHRTPLAEWNRLMSVNATAAYLCVQAFLPAMLERHWGRVVNIASTAGLSGDRYISAYAASKHALVGLTRAAAAETAPYGVTVNAVCPGYLATEMTDASVGRIVEATGRSREDAWKALRDRNPQRRLLDPQEVAAAVLYLCSDAARGVNGEALVIDGGELRR